MKKLAILTCLLFVVLSTNVFAQARYGWGGGSAPELKVVADTTSISATWDNIVSVSGQSGILYQVIFNSSNTSKDPNVRITLDAQVDSVKEASAEEVTRYVVPATGTQLQLAAAGTEDRFAAVDSTFAGGIRLDLPFNHTMKVDAHDEDGTAITRVIVIYGVYPE